MIRMIQIVSQMTRYMQFSRTIPENLPKDYDDLRKRWERDNVNKWDFGDLPETIDFGSSDGSRWTFYPALKTGKTEAMVRIRLFTDRWEAERSHKSGVARLYEIRFSKDLKFLKKSLKLPASKRK